ncbi:MAG: helix-turn-helix domain-containing protein [Deltaproteobacteria bacterium]|nr:helix-turn-helix domain-containing protein [Deltaproteobacteria bacterium]
MRSNGLNKPPNRIDLAEALRLRLQRGLTYQEIADRLGCAKSTVYTSINNVLKLVDDPQANRAFSENQVNILQGTERVLIGELLDHEKLKRASVNNLAYAFTQIHNARRLEAGMSTEQVDVHVAYEQLCERRRMNGEHIKTIKQRLAELGVTELPPAASDEGE